VLTSEGIRLRDRLKDALYQPPPELLALDAERLEALRAALRSALSHLPPHPGGIMGERATESGGRTTRSVSRSAASSSGSRAETRVSTGAQAARPSAG
jgi:hypothetical protein